MNEPVELAKLALDYSSVGVAMAVLLGWMPQMAAVLTVLWLAARLYNEVSLAVFRIMDRRRPATAQSVRLAEDQPSQE